jgi:hypothetical protein
MTMKNNVWEYFKGRSVQPASLTSGGFSFEIDFGFCRVKQPDLSSFKGHITTLKKLLADHTAGLENNFVDSEGFSVQPKAYLGTGTNNGHPLELIAHEDSVSCYYGAIRWHIELSFIEELIEDYAFILSHQSMLRKESNKFLASRYEDIINPKKVPPVIARSFIKLVDNNETK